MEEKEKQIQADFVNAYLHTFKYMGDFMSLGAEKYGISFEAYLLLHLVGENDGSLTMAKVADLQRVSRSAVARQINTLLKKEYIQQLINFEDRRVRYLKLTDAGRDVDNAISEYNNEEFSRWINVFGLDRAETALTYVKDFNDKVDKMGLTGFDGLHDKRHSQSTKKTFA